MSYLDAMQRRIGMHSDYTGLAVEVVREAVAAAVYCRSILVRTDDTVPVIAVSAIEAQDLVQIDLGPALLDPKPSRVILLKG